MLHVHRLGRLINVIPVMDNIIFIFICAWSLLIVLMDNTGDDIKHECVTAENCSSGKYGDNIAKKCVNPTNCS